MARVDRNQPRRGSASESKYTIFEFDREFPDDATCLDWLMAQHYPNGVYCPKCEKVTKHHRERNRPSYACQYCGHHEHPLKGTIFEGSPTSLKLWFYAMYLMASTRCGISAKQLERELGVTYKTAWRMFYKIRKLLEQDQEPLLGEVEVDDAYIGGIAKWRKGPKAKAGRPAMDDPKKTPVIGFAKRPTELEPGTIRAVVVDEKIGYTKETKRRVLPGSVVYTDEWKAYEKLGKAGYNHSRVHHSQGIYVDGRVHTNTIEGFWSLLKRGISGVYHGVSSEHLQSYVDEYVFRYNNRHAEGRGMFNAILDRVEKAPAPSPALPPSETPR